MYICVFQYIQIVICLCSYVCVAHSRVRWSMDVRVFIITVFPKVPLTSYPPVFHPNRCIACLSFTSLRHPPSEKATLEKYMYVCKHVFMDVCVCINVYMYVLVTVIKN